MSTPSTWGKPKHFAGTERAGEGNHTGHGRFPSPGAAKSGEENPFASRQGKRLARRIKRRRG